MLKALEPGKSRSVAFTSTFGYLAPNVLRNRSESAGSFRPLCYCAEDLVGVSTPPIVRRKNFDFAEAREPASLDHVPQTRNVDHPVAHHSAVGEHVARWHEPVADVERKESITTCSGNLGVKLAVPPHVVYIHCAANSLAQPVADVEGLAHRVDARAVCSVHRVERFDGNFHFRRSRILQRRGKTVFDQAPRRRKISAVSAQTANNHHQASRSNFLRLVHCTAVVVEHLGIKDSTFGEPSATTDSGDFETGVPDRTRCS